MGQGETFQEVLLRIEALSESLVTVCFLLDLEWRHHFY